MWRYEGVDPPRKGTCIQHPSGVKGWDIPAHVAWSVGNAPDWAVTLYSAPCKIHSFCDAARASASVYCCCTAEMQALTCVLACVATSSGRHDGLLSTELGACYYNNMRLVIHVCCVHDNTGQLASLLTTRHHRHYRAGSHPRCPSARSAGWTLVAVSCRSKLP